MSFYEGVLKVGENNDGSGFEFGFEELFWNEEWCGL